MPGELQGGLQGRGLRIAVVVARFNEKVTSRLLQGAIDGLMSREVRAEDITVVRVPGSFEIPQAAQRLAQEGTFDAVVCLGAVIRHETDHYRYIAEAAALGIAQAGRETGVPTVFGVLTTDSEEQALERSGGRLGNRGHDAALAAVEMANLFHVLGQGATD